MDDEDDENTVTIQMSRGSAERLARALRMGGEAYDFLNQLATSLGASLGISTDSEDTDPLDEGLEQGNTITWEIYTGTDNVPDEDTIVIN